MWVFCAPKAKKYSGAIQNMMNTIYAEKNFANTTCCADIGVENKLCMISFLKSSENDRIVSAGTTINVGSQKHM
jgi:hypothetical protein